MGIENEPLRLAHFKASLGEDGKFVLTKENGEMIVVPTLYGPFLQMAADGLSLAAIAANLRSLSGVWGRFNGLARFLGFLYEHGLLTDPRTIELAEALRSDYSWRESIAFEELFSLELFRLRDGRAAPMMARLTLFTIMVAMIPAVLMRIPLHFDKMAERWPQLASAWPAVAAFFITLALGRSARALVQFALMRTMTGTGPALRLRFDALSISLATDDASKAAMNIIYVLASFVALLTLTLPAMLEVYLGWLGTGVGLGLAHETALLVPFFTLELLLIDLSPFRQSALTECLRALFVSSDKSGQDAGAERLIRLLHVFACMLWVIFLGLLLAIPVPSFVSYVSELGLTSSKPGMISLGVLVLIQAVVGVSLIDDIISGIGDGGGGDRLSIRRLWVRRARSAGIGIGASTSVAGDLPTRAELERLPLLRQMDPVARTKLLENGKITDFSAGQVVCKQNDTDRTLYVLLSGRLTVAKRSSSGRKRIIAFLEPGAVFGEVAFFFGDRRTADVTSIQPSRLLAITHDDRLSNLDRNRSEELQLRIWFLQSLVSSPLFKQLPADAMDSLVFAGQKRRFKAGEKIISEGEVGDACYFIIQGQASVVQNFSAINRLKAGDAFGEIALIKPELLRTASVVADVEMLCVRVDGEKFWGLLCSHLPLAVEFEKLAETRLRKDAQRSARN